MRRVFLTLDVKMGTVSNLGNASVLEIIKECFVTLNCLIHTPLTKKPVILKYLNF